MPGCGTGPCGFYKKKGEETLICAQVPTSKSKDRFSTKLASEVMGLLCVDREAHVCVITIPKQSCSCTNSFVITKCINTNKYTALERC